MLPACALAVDPYSLHTGIQGSHHVQERVVAHMQHLLVSATQGAGRCIKDRLVRLGQAHGVRAYATHKPMPNTH